MFANLFGFKIKIFCLKFGIPLESINNPMLHFKNEVKYMRFLGQWTELGAAHMDNAIAICTNIQKKVLANDPEIQTKPLGQIAKQRFSSRYCVFQERQRI